MNNNTSYFLNSLKVIIKEDDDNIHVISLKYSKKYNYKPDLNLDYLTEINSNLSILKILKFEKPLYLDLSNIKLKNIDFLENEDLC